ncbi:MAG: alpha/beta fold hydrolase [Bacteroidetes bacterium]|nr:alpha/beta fold hydrolase [Bacteroidota bacterium]
MKKTVAIAILILILTQLVNAYPASHNVPFSDTTLVLKTNTGDVFGTLSNPSDGSMVPLVLIIAGSGPTDRDGNTPFTKNDCLKQLAKELAANNIASFRFDKRGVGQSKDAVQDEKNLLFETYIEDAASWLSILRQSHKFASITVVGHSEGSLIGMNIAQQANRFISVAGAGRSADAIIKDQLAAQSPKLLKMASPVIDSLKNGKQVEMTNPTLSALFRPSVQPYVISWFKHNPQEDLKKLQIPVLILQGTNDIQVSVDEAKLLNLASPNSKLILLTNVNHMLKNVEGGRAENIKTYNDPNLPISKELVNAIVEFLK